MRASLIGLMVAVCLATCLRARAQEWTQPDLKVESRGAMVTIQIRRVVNLGAVLEAVCEQTKSRCELAPEFAAIAVPAARLAGTLTGVVDQLLEGTSLGYVVVPPGPGRFGQLLIRPRTGIDPPHADFRSPEEIDPTGSEGVESGRTQSPGTSENVATQAEADDHAAGEPPAELEAKSAANRMVESGSQAESSLANQSRNPFGVFLPGPSPSDGAAVLVGLPFPDFTGSQRSSSAVDTGNNLPKNAPVPFPDPNGNSIMVVPASANPAPPGLQAGPFPLSGTRTH